MLDNLNTNVDFIENNQHKILDIWLDNKIVKDRLSKFCIDIKFFRDNFASKVLEHTITVAKAEQEPGNCPVLAVMLTIFKRKNIPLSDIFMICVQLKNALISFCNDNDQLTTTKLKELSILMDYNFEGVINEYVLIYYKVRTSNKSYTKEVQKVIDKIEEKKEVPKIVEDAPPIEVEAVKVTSAKDYLLDIDLDYEMVAELDELESEVLDAIYSTEVITPLIIDESAQLFEQYAKVLNTLYEFEELAYTLTILKDLLANTHLGDMDNETIEMVGAYLKAIIGDLNSWRMAVFITCQAEDIHYLDKTLLSSIAQLQITLLPQDHNTEDEIEFF
ncbi:histidine kinase [Sulfurimonas sp.]|nr:histidine kinase [Sulfurimonas sp.]